MVLSNETSGVSAIGQFHATAVAGRRDIYGHEDVDMLRSSRPVDDEINVRSEVNLFSAQNH